MKIFDRQNYLTYKKLCNFSIKQTNFSHNIEQIYSFYMFAQEVNILIVDERAVESHNKWMKYHRTYILFLNYVILYFLFNYFSFVDYFQSIFFNDITLRILPYNQTNSAELPFTQFLYINQLFKLYSLGKLLVFGVI